MRLFSYVVARDFGFAPNPFHGLCTLATCKPLIRAGASVGDWIIGTGSKSQARECRLVFAMRVTEVLTYDEYWSDDRFANKRPNLRGSLKQAYGDNIYHTTPSGSWLQENSHHSWEDGTPNSYNIESDTKSPRVLISNDFIYWGGSGPKLPKKFRDFRGYDVCKEGRGYKVRFPDKLVASFDKWANSRKEKGYVGEPLDW